jgi:hypothetical protein
MADNLPSLPESLIFSRSAPIACNWNSGAPVITLKATATH